MGQWIERHTALVQGVASTLRDIGVRPRVEERELGPNGQSGPDIYATVNEKDFALDVTTALVEQPDGLRRAAAEDLFRAQQKEKAKRDLYAAELTQRGRRLLTLCYESTGAIGGEFQRFWAAIRTHMRDNQVEPTWPRSWSTPSYLSYAQRRLAVMHASQTCRILRTRVKALTRQYVGPQGRF